MAPESFVLDPELEQLLVEVAADPDSCLLRVPRPKALPALFESDTRVSDRMAGLNLAERELLRVHRRELAELLLEVCRYKLIEGPRSRDFYFRYRADGRTMTPLDPETAAERAGGRHAEFDGPEEAATVELIHSCVSSAGEGAPTVATLATAARRLNSSIHARGLAAQDYAHGRAPWASTRVLGELIADAPTLLDKAVMWAAIGIAYSRLQQYGRSHSAYVEASTVCPDYYPAWVSRLLLACQSNRPFDALKAGRAVEVLFESNSEPVIALLEAAERRRAEGEWTPSLPAADTARAVRSQLPHIGSQVLHVMR